MPRKKLSQENNETEEKKYEMLTEPEIKFDREKYFKNPPNSEFWVHDEQVDDKLDNACKRRTDVLEKLMKVEYPAQRSAEWFKQRECVISASDCGAVLGENEHDLQGKFILKKIKEQPFQENENCYHGKKYEDISKMIYQYRMNVIVHEFGLVMHPTYKFLGASPDGIVGKFKLDGIHKTKYVGRMLEIKVPKRRPINMKSNDVMKVCPKYYFDQVQQQLECCDLDECDFWQNDLQEYKNKEEFIQDTDSKEPFRSKTTGYEKGCLIQILPTDKGYTSENKELFIFGSAKFLYPPKIEMSPYECDKWITETINNFREKEEFKNYSVDKIIYWKLVTSKCITIKRDKQWFNDALPTLKKHWDYVIDFRNNDQKKEVFVEFMEKMCNCYEKIPVRAKHSIRKKLDEIACEVSDKISSSKKKRIKHFLEKVKELDMTIDEFVDFYNNKDDIDQLTQDKLEKDKSIKERTVETGFCCGFTESE